ncbi:flagellin N-terminal helical domain-containing protein [Kineococcus indalonis]|uniref:flagellin N-terminal helical domain-containing protein n=1 Tax=Kineococcus indalonis TaxID=2696566 RepID=UPI001411B375|nr:flagellin [Kineococcus indalonis]NAZ86318.1 flagellin [Kineococcus indalonis]NAZ86319.1 flagellin [Kineococcus indalonis]
MGLRVNNNIAAFNSYRNLQATDKTLNSSLEKLSSGLRINKAADDAAGLVISEGLRSQIGGLTVAARNAQDGVNVIQTADGALNTSTTILQRMRDLTVQAENATNSTESLTAIKGEMDELAKELTRISDNTSFNGVKLLDGSFAGKFQVGDKNADSISVTVSQDFDATGLAVSGLDVTTAGGRTAAETAIDAALKKVNSARASLGAQQNRFENVISSINVAVENLTASESAIRDTDMAKEMTKFSKSQILSQAGTSMLAQANSASQNVLSLLRG